MPRLQLYMPFCPKCGKEVTSEASYCPSCGASLKVVKVEKDVLHDKVSEMRHNEIIAVFTALAGLIMACVGLVMMAITATRWEWFLIFPYPVEYHPLADVGVILGIFGLAIFLVGGINMVYYSYHRSKLLKQLE